MNFQACQYTIKVLTRNFSMRKRKYIEIIGTPDKNMVFSDSEASEPEDSNVLVFQNLWKGQFDPIICQKLKEKCEEYGTIEKMEIFKENPKGICLIHFEKECTADFVLTMMEDDIFHGRKLKIDFYDGKTDYNTSSNISQTQEKTNKQTSMKTPAKMKLNKEQKKQINKKATLGLKTGLQSKMTSKKGNEKSKKQRYVLNNGENVEKSCLFLRKSIIYQDLLCEVCSSVFFDEKSCFQDHLPNMKFGHRILESVVALLKNLA